MKKIFILPALLCCLFFSIDSKSQITYETTFNVGILSEVYLRSSGWKFMDLNIVSHQLTLYNLDYSVYKSIAIPSGGGTLTNVYFITENLFDNDSTDLEYAAMYGAGSGFNTFPITTIFDETGNQLFSADSVYPSGGDWLLYFGYSPFPILATDSGTFMLLNSNGFPILPRTKIYKLPGTFDLPTCCESGSFLGGTNQYLTGYNSGFNMYSAPNPAKNFTKVYFELPENITTGQLVFFNTLANEVKRFTVDDLFNYIQVSTDDLPSGTYSYKIITSQGASEGKQLVVVQ